MTSTIRVRAIPSGANLRGAGQTEERRAFGPIVGAVCAGTLSTGFWVAAGYALGKLIA